MLSIYFLNFDPLFGLFLPSHAEAQKNRVIQKRTAKKICTLSWNFDKDAATPAPQKKKILSNTKSYTLL